ncbi:hypothetical protein M9H77_30301 [Catharanthus roseus]|uniref:Uncharacterized protein n=1 Tax=Catharanthus roseus TaxID=4058 RepID=A0ACB9ZYX6_CATRO|nr:hypothetical protein M9H77_30301 [Catharanthus roseus]
MAGPGKRGTQTKKGKQIWLEIAALISSIPSEDNLKNATKRGSTRNIALSMGRDAKKDLHVELSSTGHFVVKMLNI